MATAKTKPVVVAKEQEETPLAPKPPAEETQQTEPVVVAKEQEETPLASEETQKTEPTEFLVKVTNIGKDRREPFSQTMMLSGKETTITVKTLQQQKQVISNINQLNSLSGFKYLTIGGGE